MPKGNSKAYLNSPFVDNAEIDINDNAVLINLALESFHTPEPNLDNPKEVEQTIDDYFKSCISKGLRPGNMGLYTRLGLTRREVNDLINGRVKSAHGKSVNAQSVGHIKKACKALSEFRESLGSHGKINPVTMVFWQKNYDGLEDVQRVDVSAVNQLQAEKSPDELAQSVINDIPND